MIEAYIFLRTLIERGCREGLLSDAYTVDELTQSYFHTLQHSVALTVLEARFRKMPVKIFPRIDAGRMIELFLQGAAFVAPAKPGRHAHPVTLPVIAALALLLADPDRRGPELQLGPGGPGLELRRGRIQEQPRQHTAAGGPRCGHDQLRPDGRDRAKHLRAAHPGRCAPGSPRRAGQSPGTGQSSRPSRPTPTIPARSISRLASSLTAIRDDSLKISMEDIEIARAQLSQSIAALWPTFTVNQPAAVHPLRQSTDFR